MRIKAEDTMALIIDLQERLVPVMSEREDVIHNTMKLIEGLNILGIPSVVTQQYTKGLGMTIPSIMRIYGEAFAYMDKIHFSCMDETEILHKIESYQKKNVIVCGIETHVCVQQTVIDLLAAGYQVILVEDCVSSRKSNDKKIAVKRMYKEGATLATYESILFELARVSGNEEFKAISKIVK